MPKHHSQHRDHAAAPSQRTLRVGELVRHALAEMLARGEVHDPVIEGHMITVPEVTMSPDLRVATVYIMPLGGRDATDVVAALDRNRRFLRGEIAHRINLRSAPDLRFKVDDRFEEAARIDRLLQSPEVRRDLEKTPDEEE
jgi:ribosome-binding factor A